MDYRIRRFDVVESTNTTCRELAAAGADEGLVVLAVAQTAARGRLGRRWHSPSGGLWFSLLLRPDIPAADAPVLVMPAGMAVAGAVESVTGLRPLLKWPNDCLVRDRKIAGILCEAACSGKRLEYVVLGVGVNVNNSFAGAEANGMERTAACVPPEPDGCHAAIDWESASAPPGALLDLCGGPVDAERLLDEFLLKFQTLRRRVADGLRGELVSEWTARSATVGKRVRILTGDASRCEVEGTAVGIDSDFALQVRTATGDIARVVCGDCVHVQ
ncbi:MAG: biotin--[acetyl-CoA-carboxylase] ligase [Planctomycetota bacterium]|nr:biotin--[acetyl-CoA-carboxylase] ligase [Planctomycetota bacterium]